jgi:hypothetical protein
VKKATTKMSVRRPERLHEELATDGRVWVIDQERCALAQHFHAQRRRFRFPPFRLLAKHGPLALSRLVLWFFRHLVLVISLTGDVIVTRNLDAQLN